MSHHAAAVPQHPASSKPETRGSPRAQLWAHSRGLGLDRQTEPGTDT